MKKLLFASLLLLFFNCSSSAQEQAPKMNLDFEAVDDDRPVGWMDFGNGDYALKVDDQEAQSGERSVSIASVEGAGDYHAWSYTIPANYDGQKIRLTGYIKTENVTDGWAGLWLRLDPRVAFDNMEQRGITGTTDWKPYAIELDYDPKKVTDIVLGGLLVGKGKIWVDNLKITIDGKPLSEVPPKKLLPAQLDKEFDNGSGIVFDKLDDSLIDDLELLGKVWGFLKYHHPAIAEGELNWDYELFRFLPKFLASKSKRREADIVEWIEALGPVANCTTCQPVDPEAFLTPDFAWLDNAKLSETLRDKISNLRANRHQGDHFYVNMVQNVGNPNFTFEAPYENMPYPDDGFRLLALYKYWNIIHYFFPYRHLMDKPWAPVLREYLPVFLNAKDELGYEQAAVRIIGDVQDTHANLWGGRNAIEEDRGKYYPPFDVKFIEGKLVVTDYYNPEKKAIAGLEIGDVITTIKGEAIMDIVERVKPFYPASNEPTRLRNIAKNLLQHTAAQIEIEVSKNGKSEKKNLKLYVLDEINYYNWYPESDEKSFRMLEDNIGYITLKTIAADDVSKIKSAFKDAKGIVIDIRNYPSSFMPFALGSFFMKEPTAFVKFTSGSVDQPGQFTFGDELLIPNAEEYFGGPVVVLLNEYSQSQAEYTAMAFRAGDNTTVMGSTTAGADGNISRILLPGGLSTVISGIGVYYPDGRETQRVGIVPDIEVKPTIQGIRAGRDEVLERAVEFIKAQ